MDKPVPPMQSPILAALNAGKTILTPNATGAELVRQRHTMQMIAAERHAWQSAQVLPWRTWLIDFYERTQFDAPTLLSQEQALLLWEQVVGEEPDIAIQQVSQFTRLAAEAWASKHLWQLDFASFDTRSATYEVRLFEKWQIKFARRCTELGLVDAYQAASNLLALMQNDHAAAPTQAQDQLLVGYTSVPPLLAKLAPYCWDILHMGETDPNATEAIAAHPLQSFDNASSELEAAIEWAVQQQTASPDQVVAIALSNPNLMQDAVNEGLRRYQFGHDDKNTQQLLTDINRVARETLSDTKLAQSALRLLGLGPQISGADATALLLDPYLGNWQTERGQRALLDREIRSEVREISFSTSYFVSLLGRESVALGELHEQFTALLTAREALPYQQNLIDWQTQFEQELAGFNWPAGDSLSAEERAARDAWQSALDALVSLSPFTGLCSRRHALHRLNALVQQRVFNPPTAPRGIRIINFEQAALFSADVVAWCGLGQHQWPVPVAINPLLPFAMQRGAGMPGLNPQMDASLALTEFSNSVAATPINRFSFTALVEDVENTPVSLFSALDATQQHDSLLNLAQSTLQFDVLEDAHGLALATETVLRNAVRFFADQAACPFRAYAEHRLASETIEEPALGLDARRRGELVHLAVASLWDQLQTSEKLQAMSDAELTHLIDNVVSQTVSDYRRESRQLPQYWVLESEHLKRLLNEWLMTERDRLGFEVVETEKKLAAEVANFRFNVRIDRIDRLADGTLAIIDFKTGDDKRKSWDVPRVEQPQLPIYATNLAAGEVSAIAYAKLRSGECELVDLPRGALAKGKQDEAWQDKVTAWRHDLFSAAEQMEQGFAQVDPKHNDACRYCKQRLFCRIGELRRDEIAPFGDDSGDQGV